jgi:hypothetical protein
MNIEFQAWPKTPRLFRTVTITEKIDGTNAAVIVTEDGQVAAQSRKRLITPEDDNYGFARWVQDNSEYLRETLGTGYHFGEWWGQGIQRRYGMDRKVFSLFNTRRFSSARGATFELDSLRVVPVLFEGVFEDGLVEDVKRELVHMGSFAAPGFDRPEGICVFHQDASQVFKVLIENDHLPKSLAA